MKTEKHWTLIHRLYFKAFYRSYISWQTSSSSWIVATDYSESFVYFSHFVLVAGPLSYLLAIYQLFIIDI